MMTFKKDLFIYSLSILAIQCIRPVWHGAEKSDNFRARGVWQNVLQVICIWMETFSPRLESVEMEDSGYRCDVPAYVVTACETKSLRAVMDTKVSLINYLQNANGQHEPTCYYPAGEVFTVNSNLGTPAIQIAFEYLSEIKVILFLNRQGGGWGRVSNWCQISPLAGWLYIWGNCWWINHQIRVWIFKPQAMNHLTKRTCVAVLLIMQSSWKLQTLWALPSTQRKVAHRTAQVAFLVCDQHSCRFHAQHPCCVSNKSTCTHLCTH